MTAKNLGGSTIPAIKVNQWLPVWNKIKFDAKALQAKPQQHFYICSIKASHLKALTGVYRRSTKGGLQRAKDPNVQRGHVEERSNLIKEYVQWGFPWCEMTETRRKSEDAEDLQKPGWLPTAILVNILPEGERRNGKAIPDGDRIKVDESNAGCRLMLPRNFSGANWEPDSVFPLEVIDGQHRLWAFDDFDPGNDFELPVVAFHGLDRSWQAYLFWSVNITPQKINRSLAFDLYPLLRREDWLEKFAGHSIYRETRSQELVEALWLNEKSPWHQRINMLGETKQMRERPVPMVTQAAWVRSLMATFVKQWEGQGTKIGGLFGAPGGEHDLFLPWNRPMQAAFLIRASSALKASVEASKAAWARNLRSFDYPDLFENEDAAFYGVHSLLTTDQGIRGFLYILNDLLFVSAEELHLTDWSWESLSASRQSPKAAATEDQLLDLAIKSFSKTKANEFVEEIANGLASYDWRTSSTPQLEEAVRLKQSVFRGSSGYKELRRQLLQHLSHSKGPVGTAAKKVAYALGLDK